MIKSNPKKKTSRKNKKFAALDPIYTPKVRKEYLDMDYIDKLSEKEKTWLNKFMEESLNASFEKDNRKNIIKSKVERKKIYNENNARNRCMYSIAKSARRLDEYIYEDQEEKNESLSPEDALIEYIDNKYQDNED